MADLNSTFHEMMDRKDSGLTEQDYLEFKLEVDDLFEKYPREMDHLNDVLVRPYARVYAVGIGNSLYAPESLKFAFRSYSGIEIEVIEAHEFNMYYIDYMPENSLVIICSHGGSAARTVETAFLAKKRGATVLALTCQPSSRLRAAATHCLCYKPHNDKAYIWGSGGYEALAIMYVLTGIRMGVLSGHLNTQQEKAAQEAIYATALVGYRSTMDNDELMRKIMFEAQPQKAFYFLGAGPSYIMTEYACAKFMEQGATISIHQQIEEYGHEQYWIHNRNKEDDYVFLIAPAGKSIQRAAEDIKEISFLGLKTVLITTKGVDESIKGMATYVVESSELVEENLFALVSCNILSRLANYRALSLGNQGDRFASNEQYSEHYEMIHYSRFCEEVAEYDIPMPSKETVEKVGPQGISFNNEHAK